MTGVLGLTEALPSPPFRMRIWTITPGVQEDGAENVPTIGRENVPMIRMETGELGVPELVLWMPWMTWLDPAPLNQEGHPLQKGAGARLMHLSEAVAEMTSTPDLGTPTMKTSGPGAEPWMTPEGTLMRTTDGPETQSMMGDFWKR